MMCLPVVFDGWYTCLTQQHCSHFLPLPPPPSPSLPLISEQVEEERKPPPVEGRPVRRGQRAVEEDTDTGVM